MKITHAGLFNRAADSYDFAAIWAIEDACSRDLEEAEEKYDEAVIRFNNATTEHDKNWAKAEKEYARAVWLEKYAAYVDFMKGF